MGARERREEGTRFSHLIFGYFAIFHFIKHFLRICHINLLERVKKVIIHRRVDCAPRREEKKTNKFLISRARLKGRGRGLIWYPGRSWLPCQINVRPC